MIQLDINNKKERREKATQHLAVTMAHAIKFEFSWQYVTIAKAWHAKISTTMLITTGSCHGLLLVDLCAVYGQQWNIGFNSTKKSFNIRVAGMETRKPSWRKGYARQQCVYTAILDFWNAKVAPLVRPSPETPSWNQIACRSANRLRSYGHFCISKMAVSRHLGFYRIGNSAIRFAFPENPSL